MTIARQVFTAVNISTESIVKLVVLATLVPSMRAQTDADRERRLAELERKIQMVDPAFTVSRSADFDVRLAAIEKKMDGLLAGRVAPEPATPSAPAALQVLSVAGDQQTSKEAETPLPVAGYMDAHFNKNSGEPGRGDFHRFVLLFGHSFSDRIKFWSELEIEHALIEGGEEKGEVALEQAYLDFLVKPWLNVRAGMILSPVGLINERHEPPSFNGVERPFVETVIIPTTWHEMGFGLTGIWAEAFVTGAI